MSNTINTSIEPPDDKENQNTSVGTGTSDQGIEPGQEDQEDEFRNGVPEENFVDETVATGESKKPRHGLVEEGPGPDS